MWEKIKDFMAGLLVLLIVSLAGGICVGVILLAMQVAAHFIMALFNLG